EIAVDALDRVQKGGRRTRGCERGSDLPADESGLANARDDHAPVARHQEIQGGLERGAEVALDILERFAFHAKHATTALDGVHGHNVASSGVSARAARYRSSARCHSPRARSRSSAN